MNVPKQQNVNIATTTYQEALGVVKHLSPSDALRLAVQLLSKLAFAIYPPKYPNLAKSRVFESFFQKMRPKSS